MKIVLLARSLEFGGTERQISLLARGLRAKGHDVTVVLFFCSGSFLEQEVIAGGSQIVSLEKKSRWDLIGFFWRAARQIRALRPTAVYAFLPTANIVSILIRPLLRGTRIVLGVRASNMDLSRYDWLTRLSYLVEGKLARFADGAIANAAVGRSMAIARGFSAASTVVIANGVDKNRFRVDPDLRLAVRAEWGIDSGTKAIGVVARLDPMKGHRVFLGAARIMLDHQPDLRFLCIGDGPDLENLRNAVNELGLTQLVTFLPARADIEAVLNALDLMVLPSLFGEGSSNALAEAMACGIRCVASDVGNARELLGNVGALVPPGDEKLLAQACLSILATKDDLVDRERRRARVLSLLGIDTMVDRTEVWILGHPLD